MEAVMNGELLREVEALTSSARAFPAGRLVPVA
jgi:hypothetical protein